MGNEFASDEKTASTGLMPRRLGHVNLFVSDLERSMAFYENVAGFHEIFREPDIQAGFLSNGNTHHDFGLIQTSDVDRVDKTGKVLIAASQRGREPGLNHLGFEMSNQRELVLAYQRLKQAGANVGRTVDHGLARSVYLPDPDGNTLEFYADTVEDWRAFWKANLGKTVTHGWSPDLATASAIPLHPVDAEMDPKPQSPLKSRRVYAATLNTENLAELAAFYERVVGLRLVRGSVALGECAFGTEFDEICLILRQVDSRRRALEAIHIELQPKQGVADARDELRRLGMEVRAGEASAFPIVLEDPDGFGVHFATI